jgi:hypothetical protein
MDMSMATGAGGLPVKVTLPVRVEAVAGSTGAAAGKLVVVAVVGVEADSEGGVECLQPVRVRAARRRRVELVFTVDLWR